MSPLIADTAAAAPSVDTESLRGTVLVWHDAAFYAAPSDSESPISVATLAARQAGYVVPMHVVGVRGAFVEVEFADDEGCTWSRLSISDDIAKLHLFVKRDDLAPVLVKPFDKTFSDGTHIALKPGTPVAPTANGYAVSLLGHEIEVEILATSVAHSYKSASARVLTVTDHDYLIAPGTKAVLGDRTVALDGIRGSAMSRRGDTALVTFEERCLSLVVAAPASAVRPTDADREEPASLTGYGTLGLRDGDYLPRLTALSSPSGRQLAYAAKPIYLMGTSRNKLTCIDRRLRLEPARAGAPAVSAADVDDHLRLCAPTTKVVHEQLRSARSASGSTSR